MSQDDMRLYCKYCLFRTTLSETKKYISLGVKRLELGSDDSPAYSAEVKNAGSCNSTVPTTC